MRTLSAGPYAIRLSSPKGERSPAPRAAPRPSPAGPLPRHPDFPGKQKRPTAGFRVEYSHLGRAEQRSRYDPVTLTIHLNLDHPLITAALGHGSVEDTTFRRLSYEIAFSEYAMGLGYEISRQDPNIAADDLLYEVRATLNRVSTAAVGLYR